MSTINSILIKRRLASSPLNDVPTLSGGELAFSEKNNTLYYGGEFSTLEIGGDGAYVTRDTNQSISGDKTFTGSTTLSSTTFSSDSVLDFGGNILTNIGTPGSDSDAATKLYVDTVATNSSTATDSLSTEVYNTFVKLIDDRAVDLSGGLTVSGGISSDTITTTGNASVGGNLTITGDLSVLGATTTIETTTTMTSAFAISNAGSGPALSVTQTGATDVAAFYDGDEANVALVIKDGGNVGIGTDSPSEKLEVDGNLKVSGGVEFDLGTFTVTGGGNVTTAGNITVSGTIDASSSITTTSNLTVGGTTTLDNNSITTDGSGSMTINGQLTVNSASSLDAGNITTDGSGAMTLNGQLTVNNASSLDSGSITTDGSGSITGTAGTSELVNFIIDGGTF